MDMIDNPRSGGSAMATWVGPPKSYSPGRNRPVQFVVVHCTAGSENPDSAENGAAYDKVRTDGTSTHIFADQNSSVRLVRDEDRAHHARFHGNEIGLGLEICGGANQSDAQWHDAASYPTLIIAARETAAWCKLHSLPVRRLSVAEVRAAYYAPTSQRPKGICGHVDVTNAYPEDQGSHYDPGTHFPWAEFLAMVSANMEGDDMLRVSFANFPDLPANVGDRIHQSDGLRYRIIQKATTGNRVLNGLAGAPTVLTPANCGFALYADAVKFYCGTPDPGEQAGEGSAGLTPVELAAVKASAHDGAVEGVAAAEITIPSLAVSLSGSMTGTATSA